MRGFKRLVDFDPFCLLVIVIMIDSSEKRNCKLDFTFQSARVIEKRTKADGLRSG